LFHDPTAGNVANFLCKLKTFSAYFFVLLNRPKAHAIGHAMCDVIDQLQLHDVDLAIPSLCHFFDMKILVLGPECIFTVAPWKIHDSGV
jgi:hypothetical protein